MARKLTSINIAPEVSKLLARISLELGIPRYKILEQLIREKYKEVVNETN